MGNMNLTEIAIKLVMLKAVLINELKTSATDGRVVPVVMIISMWYPKIAQIYRIFFNYLLQLHFFA